jgi:HK97 family phage portal protein
VRGYAAQLDEVYCRNPVGLRAVRLVAGLVGSLPLYIDDGDPRSIDLLRAKGLLEQAAAALLLHGNAYVRLAVDGHDRPAELHCMRPERVSVVTGADGWPAAYLYRAGGQVTRVARQDALQRRQVAHLKALNPADDHYGLGCLEAAAGAACVHNRASRWNRSLLDNAARPSGALVYEPGDGSNLSSEQFDRLQKELAEQFSGSANAGRPLLLDGGLKWQTMGLSPADMDPRDCRRL